MPIRGRKINSGRKYPCSKKIESIKDTLTHLPADAQVAPARAPGGYGCSRPGDRAGPRGPSQQT